MSQFDRVGTPLRWLAVIIMVTLVIGSMLIEAETKLDSCKLSLAACEAFQSESAPEAVCDHTPSGPVPPSFLGECELKCKPMAAAVNYDRSYGWKCLCDPDVGC